MICWSLTVLDQELAHEPSTALVRISFSRGKDGMEVLSEVRTPRVIQPERVKEIQDALSSSLGESVRMRTDVLVTGQRYHAVGDARLAEEGEANATSDVRSP